MTMMKHMNKIKIKHKKKKLFFFFLFFFHTDEKKTEWNNKKKKRRKKSIAKYLYINKSEFPFDFNDLLTDWLRI